MQRVRFQSAALFAPLSRLAAGAWGWCRRELRYRREIEHLNRLDDTALADLGLRRSGIDGAVRGHFDPHDSRPARRATRPDG